MQILNFSGHPAIVNGTTHQPKVGMLDQTSPETLINQLETILLELDEFEDLKAGQTATIILPSMSTAVAPFLAIWHGLFGTFPIIRWAVRTETGFVFEPDLQIDLQNLRNEVRTKRFK